MRLSPPASGRRSWSNSSSIPMRLKPLADALAAAGNNPLLQPWPEALGVPPLASIDIGDFVPAFEAAIAEEQREIAGIIAQEAEPDFENSVAALERCGETLARV